MKLRWYIVSNNGVFTSDNNTVWNRVEVNVPIDGNNVDLRSLSVSRNEIF